MAAGVQLARAAVRRLPLDAALGSADLIGTFLFLVLQRTRKLALANLAAALGEQVSPRERRAIAEAALANAVRCFVEVARMDEILQRDDYVRLEGWEYAEEAVSQGRGVIAVTGHLGNWELLGASLAHRGLPITAVARRISNPRLNDWLVEIRRRHGVESILRQDPAATRRILTVLRLGGVLALLIDQDTRAPSVSVPFFGRAARTPIAPAVLAIRRGMPLVVAACLSRPDGGRVIRIGPPIHVPARATADVAAVTSLTARLNRDLEALIRASPGDWVWWHRRWRHAPIAGLDADA